jgi:biopolymer transport protein TolQ
MNADNFSIVATFLRADWVVRLVMIGLGLASLWSWTIILDKSFRLGALNRAASRFEEEVNSGRTLEDISHRAGPEPNHPLPRMLQAALHEWRESRRASMTDIQIILLTQRIDRSLDATVAREAQRVEDGLGSLAIVATASPFVGLFGTVWGIMSAFQAIAIQKNTSLAVVAPAIAQALFATAIGLAAAIPAYIAYNKFSTDAARFTARLESFADDLAAAVARRLGGDS